MNAFSMPLLMQNAASCRVQIQIRIETPVPRGESNSLIGSRLTGSRGLLVPIRSDSSAARQARDSPASLSVSLSLSLLSRSSQINRTYRDAGNKFPAASAPRRATDWTRYKFTRNPPSTYRCVRSQPGAVLTRRIRPLDPNQSLVNAIGWVG